MLKRLTTMTLALGLLVAGTAQADSILVYEKSTKDGAKTTQTISITGRWLRIDLDPKGSSDYMLMDTGRMILFEVDDSAKSYMVTRVGKFYWPELPAPALKPKMERTKLVTGIRCRQVQEVLPEKPASEHCLVTGAQLGLNAREMKTLSRLFVIARRIGWDWPSISTPDERMASISSSDRVNGVSQTFVSVKHKGIPDSQVKIPDTYKRIMAEQKKPGKEQVVEAENPEAEGAAETATDTKSENQASPEPAVEPQSGGTVMPETEAEPELAEPAKVEMESTPETEDSVKPETLPEQ